MIPGILNKSFGTGILYVCHAGESASTSQILAQSVLRPTRSALRPARSLFANIVRGDNDSRRLADDVGCAVVFVAQSGRFQESVETP